MRPEGFEPPTNGFGSHYSIRLSYERLVGHYARTAAARVTPQRRPAERPGTIALPTWARPDAAPTPARPGASPGSRLGARRMHCAITGQRMTAARPHCYPSQHEQAWC